MCVFYNNGIKFALVGVLLVVSSLCAEYRTFTDDFGNAIEAELIEFGTSPDGEWVKIKLEGGRVVKSELKFFSVEDQKYIRDWFKEKEERESLLTEEVRLDINLKLNRKMIQNRRNSSYYDDETIIHVPELTVDNGDITQNYTENTVRIVTIAKDLKFRSQILIASASNHKVDFPSGEATTIKGDSFRLRKYEYEGYSDYEYGYEYLGFIIVVKNREGKITHTRASLSKYLENMDIVMNCSAGQIYDDSLSEKLNAEPNSYYLR